eukprot:scaffold112015_cov19-Tisochrysis_lutea.AAC.1
MKQTATPMSQPLSQNNPGAIVSQSTTNYIQIQPKYPCTAGRLARQATPGALLPVQTPHTG